MSLGRPVDDRNKPSSFDAFIRRQPKWLVRIVDTVAVLSVAYGLGLAIWVIAHRTQYSAVPTISPAIWLWIINLPFLLLGFLWLVARFVYAYWVPLQRFASHSFIARYWPLLIASAFATAIWLCSLL